MKLAALRNKVAVALAGATALSTLAFVAPQQVEAQTRTCYYERTTTTTYAADGTMLSQTVSTRLIGCWTEY